jgi:putative DNA primase/helicase
VGSIDVDGLKARTDIVSVVGAYVALKKRGAEFVGLCPFHADKNPSFWVSPAKQFCHCFSCGANKDVIEFMQDMEGLDFKAACERLGACTWEPKAPIAHERSTPLPERITSKPPADAEAPNMAIRALGEPSRIYTIRDLDGSLWAYECRYDQPEGKKEVRIWSWGARGDREPGWGVGHLNVLRPLYGLERLADHPKSPVLITEGPKKADAGAVLLPAYASISWTGGANAWHKHDYAPLGQMRTVLIFPDNDEPGIAAAGKLAAVLSDPRGLACRVRVVDPTGQPEGWDIADWTGTTEELIAWAKPRARDYVRAATEAQDEPPALDGAELPPEQEEAPQPKTRTRPKLAVVGNTVLAQEPDAELLPQAMSEDALAKAFVEAHGKDWRYVKTWGQWFEWDGDGWRRDDTAKIDHLAVQITRQALYWDEAKSLTPKERRMVNKRSTAGALRDVASANRKIAATIDQWDADPWALGVPGGVIDLRSAKLFAPEREQHITKRCAVSPDSGPPTRWLEYMKRCHNGDEQTIAYLQRYAGYCCTGETGEHAFAFLYGTGRNGKGVFLETISRVLGDYAKTASITTFLEQRNPAHSTELARLHKARLVVTEEAGVGGKWNEARIKHMTGGGKITARYMRQDDFEFTPSFKLLVAANHKPMLKSVDEAMKSRIHLVPFSVTIPAAERDPNLLEKLEAEWPQILGWMLEGCAQWQEKGLAPPQRILDATDEYVQSEDILADWMAACCVMEGEVDGADAYKSYAKWCDEQGHSAWSRIGWSRALTERGTVDGRRSNGRTIFMGLSLKPAY